MWDKMRVRDEVRMYVCWQNHIQLCHMWHNGHFQINNYCTVFGERNLYNCINKFDSTGWKIWDEIPICTCDTAVGVHGCVWCLNLVTAPAPVSPVSETPWVTLELWQSLVTMPMTACYEDEMHVTLDERFRWKKAINIPLDNMEYKYWVLCSQHH